jgi:CxxC motif-containing protein
MSEKIICITCPLGCQMAIDLEGKKVIKVKGHQCKKGLTYAQEEVTFPGRILTTTMRTNLPAVPLLPVRSNKALPKNMLMACMKEIVKQIVDHPVKLGEALIENILGSGVDIVACRTTP